MADTPPKKHDDRDATGLAPLLVAGVIMILIIRFVVSLFSFLN